MRFVAKIIKVLIIRGSKRHGRGSSIILPILLDFVITLGIVVFDLFEMGHKISFAVIGLRLSDQATQSFEVCRLVIFFGFVLNV